LNDAVVAAAAGGMTVRLDELLARVDQRDVMDQRRLRAQVRDRSWSYSSRSAV
jgi:hypothetical protein